MRTFVLLSLALVPPASAQVVFQELTTINLDRTSNVANPEYIGSNPAAVAWDGMDLYVAGFNNSGAASGVSIVKITDALNTQVFGTPFGGINTPSLRGYSGLDVVGAVLAAAYDDGGANANGITAFDLNGNPLWQKSARGGSGVGFDPGFPGGNPAQGMGTGWTTFGSGRRALQDSATGSDIWTTANGAIVLTSEGTFWRDMDYDDATGDIYLREGNNVIRGTRTGDNGFSMSILFDPTDADFVNGQNVAFVSNGLGSIVIYNDRGATNSGQNFATVIQAMRPDGTPEALDFGAFAPLTGNGYYDFSWDAATETLAVLDFANRNVHLFQLVTLNPWYAYGAGCPGTNGLVPALYMSGDATPGVGTIALDLTDGLPSSAAIFVFGLGQGALPLFGMCTLNVLPIIGDPAGPLSLDGMGAVSLSFLTPPGSSGVSVTAQAFVADPSGALGLVSGSNGLQLIIP